MSKAITLPQLHRLTNRLGRLLLGACCLSVLVACEAPLNLQKVEQEQALDRHRFDQFKGLAAGTDKIVAIADAGVVLVSDNKGDSWQRIQLPSLAALTSVTACPNGSFVAIDTRHQLWLSDASAMNWKASKIDTQESLMGLACGPDNKIWLGASFSTLLSSDDQGASWTTISQDDDFQITAIQFVNEKFAVAAAEFGNMLYSHDAGKNWQRGELLPNEFYPMGAYFKDETQGWVSGLSGTILHTADAGQTWTRQDTARSVPLYGISPVGERLFAVGDNGTLLEYAQGRWHEADGVANISSYLIAALAVDDQHLLLAGGAGTLIKHTLAAGTKQ